MSFCALPTTSHAFFTRRRPHNAILGGVSRSCLGSPHIFWLTRQPTHTETRCDRCEGGASRLWDPVDRPTLFRQEIPTSLGECAQQVRRYFHAPQDEVSDVPEKVPLSSSSSAFHEPNDIVWVSPANVQELHYKVMIMSQEMPRIMLLDVEGLAAAVEEPRNAFNYGVSDLFDLAALLGYGIAMRHPFFDGNKRAALYSTCVFLELNNFSVDPTAQYFDDVMVELVTHQLSQDEFSKLLRKHAQPTHPDEHGLI
eukprot:gb/GEZN01016252.1/.p1 GENE.gb/GEZN01016252.1/~~gb/GEZN01016252.1/.p1  ORF type:complete len:254 (+),score=12.34 gb/GEZN01016252.1/:56-817(+)